MEASGLVVIWHVSQRYHLEIAMRRRPTALATCFLVMEMLAEVSTMFCGLVYWWRWNGSGVAETWARAQGSGVGSYR